MQVLTLIWASALWLALAALLWMGALIGLRLAHERRMARHTADRRRVETILVGVMQGRPEAVAQLAPYAGRGRLMAEVALDFLGLVRGQDRERVLAAMRAVEVDAALRQRLHRGSLTGRLAALEALSVFPGPETEAALRDAADSRQPRMRLAALRSLWAAGGGITLDRLLDDLKAGLLPRSGLLTDFMRGLAAADPNAAIRASARDDLTPAMWVMLLGAIGESGDYQTVPLVMSRAIDPQPEVRAAAVQALGRLRHPSAEPALRRGLADQHWQVRAAASEAVGAAGLSSLAEPLRERLGDPVWRVRFQAASALADLGPPGMNLLEQAASSPVEAARRAAALALAEWAA